LIEQFEIQSLDFKKIKWQISRLLIAWPAVRIRPGEPFFQNIFYQADKVWLSFSMISAAFCRLGLILFHSRVPPCRFCSKG